MVKDMLVGSFKCSMMAMENFIVPNSDIKENLKKGKHSVQVKFIIKMEIFKEDCFVQVLLNMVKVMNYTTTVKNMWVSLSWVKNKVKELTILIMGTTMQDFGDKICRKAKELNTLLMAPIFKVNG